MKEKPSNLTEFLALAVFALFALCLFGVLLTGAKVYRNLVDQGSRSYADRTAAMYLSTRVRQSGGITVEEFDGCPALVSREEIDGRTYVTRVYCWDGYLRELFCAENAALSPEDGEIVLEAETFSLKQEGNLLRIQFGTDELLFHLPTGMEVGP